MVNQQNAGNILNFVFEKSKLFLLLTFVSFRKLLFWFRVVAMVFLGFSPVFLQNLAREIGARATRIYAFAHWAFDRGEAGTRLKAWLK